MNGILKHPFFVGIIGVAVGLSAVGYFYFSGSSLPNYKFTTVNRGDISEIINIDGMVRPVTSVDLMFEKSGMVDRVYFHTGDKVKAGDVLVSLDSADLRAQLSQADAGLAAAQAKLDEMKAGPTAQQIAVSKSSLAAAETSLAGDYNDIPQTVRDSYNKADDAVRIQTTGLFQLNGSAYSLTFSSCDNQAAIDSQYLRQTSEAALIKWSGELNLLNASGSLTDLENSLNETRGNLALFGEFLDRTYANLTTNCIITNQSYDNYRSKINAARGEIGVALDSVNNLKDKIAADKAEISQDQNTLNELLAGVRPEEIATQEAIVKSASANVDIVKSELDKDYLRSPIDGTVAKQNGKVGEVVSPNASLVSLISYNKFKIETYVPDADVAKIAVGEPAKITLDAYGSGVVFDAKVVSVDPTETIQNSIAVYKTTLQFVNEDARPKSGMNANIEIVVGQKSNVLLIPQRAVITRGRSEFVLADAGNGRTKELQIETGLRGTDGNIEVVSGLTEGEKIVDF